MQIFIIVAMVIFVFMFGFGIGAAVENASAFLEPNVCNGWAIRWLKHFICGAFCGHKWKPESPEVCGWKGVRCARCGKTKVVRVVKKEVKLDA